MRFPAARRATLLHLRDRRSPYARHCGAGGIEQHFWDLRFAETGRGTDAATTPTGPPDMVVLEEMAKDLTSYDTEVIAYCSNFD